MTKICGKPPVSSLLPRAGAPCALRGNERRAEAGGIGSRERGRGLPSPRHEGPNHGWHRDQGPDGARHRQPARDRPRRRAEARRVRRRADRRPFKEGAEETARLLRERGAEPVVIQADVARPEDISRMFAEARAKLGPALRVLRVRHLPRPPVAAAARLADLAVWLEASALARLLKAGPWLYPLVNLAHLLGIALLVGAIAVLDLRLVGFWPGVPVAALARGGAGGRGRASPWRSPPARRCSPSGPRSMWGSRSCGRSSARWRSRSPTSPRCTAPGLGEARRTRRWPAPPPPRPRRRGFLGRLARRRPGGADDRLLVRAAPQNSSPFRSMPWTPFSPFTVCVTRKSTAREQSW